MTAGNRQPARAHPRKTRHSARFGLWLMSSVLFLATLTGLALLAVTGRPFQVPGVIVAHVETRLNAALGDRLQLRLGAAEIQLEDGFTPRLALRDLEVHVPGRGSAPLAQIPMIETRLSRQDLLDGHLRPTLLRLSGGHVILRRDTEGRFDLAFGQGDFDGPGSLAEVLASVDRVFNLPILRGLARIEADGLTLTLEDARAQEVWQVTDGRVALVQDAEAVALNVGFGMTGTWGTPARADLRFVSRKGSPESELEVRVEDVASTDLAAQGAALAWLGVLEAPISGTLNARIDAEGALAALTGELGLGAGAVRPVAGMPPIAFDVARFALSYDPAAQRLEFADVTVDSPTLRLGAQGHAYLRDMEQGLPRTMLGQFSFADVQMDPEGIFDEPVRFSTGAVDLRLALDPFMLTLGQMVLVEDGRRLSAKGSLGAQPQGWEVALDVSLNEITHDRLLALWPREIVRGMRNWLVENVQTGLIYNVNGALRLSPGQEPRLALGYEFSGADVSFLRTMPPILSGQGYATVDGTTYTMVLDSGQVAASQGGMIDITDSVFQVRDVMERPPVARLELNTDSSITAALAFLDEPPFRFLSRSNRPVDLADGRARLHAELSFPIQRDLPAEDVIFHVTGDLTGVTSDQILPGRTLRAEAMTLEATPARLQISGSGQLQGLPFEAAWTQPLGPGSAGQGSRIEGSAPLTAAVLAEFAPGLPKGTISGQGAAEFTVALPPGQPPQLSLRGDLRGAAVAIPQVGWRKPAASAGTLQLEGTLGEVPRFNRVAVDAPGLRAEGSLALRAGGLDALRLSRVRLGGWLDAPVVLRGQGGGRSLAVELNGGTIDLRNLPEMGSGGGGSTGSVPINGQLDRVIVTEALSLTGLQGRFSTQNGFNGLFEARVNGTTPVSGSFTPALLPDGRLMGQSVIRVQSQDAGAILAATGIFTRAVGGALDLQIIPRGGGHFDGALRVGRLSVHGAPVLLEVLGALTLVGLVEQMNGQGLVFDEITAEFRLTPQGIEIIRSAAVGPSLGVTLAGIYDSTNRSIDMKGVVSPFYLINVVGSLIARPGEGLFGFNYALSGPASAPRVGVNPLSLLAPGAVRDLLRRPAPTLQGPAVTQDAR